MVVAWPRFDAERALGAAALTAGVFVGAVSYAQTPSMPAMQGPPTQAPAVQAPVAPAATKVATPRAADGKPDLSGIWIAGGAGVARATFDASGSGAVDFAAREGSFENFENDNALRRLGDRNKPLYRPEFWAKVREDDANGNQLDPEFKCRPYGVPRLGAPAQIVQTTDQVVLLYAGGFAGQNTFRVVPTDGRAHNQARVIQETWKGDSVGHWEGDVLVIDTIGFTDESWLHKSGYFHGFKLHVTERLTRDGNTLRWEATVEDPEVLLEPWKMNPVIRVLDTRPNAFVPEDLPCEERDGEHIVSKARSG
jgi:hypothetical protein